MTQAGDRLDAVRIPLDTFRPDETEAAVAGSAFTKGVDTLFLNNIGFLISQEDHNGDPLHADLFLIAEQDDGSALRIILRRYSEDHASEIPGQRPVYRAHITEERPEHGQGRVVFYNVAKNSPNVTRKDATEDFDAKIELNEQLHPKPDFFDPTLRDEVRQYLEEDLNRALGELENSRLEIAMGLNEQPVGTEEIKDLLAILNVAQPINKETWDRRFEIRYAAAQLVVAAAKAETQFETSVEQSTLANRLQRAVNFLRRLI